MADPGQNGPAALLAKEERQAFVAALLARPGVNLAQVYRETIGCYGVSRTTVSKDIRAVRAVEGTTSMAQQRREYLADGLRDGVPMRTLVPDAAGLFGVAEHTIISDLEAAGEMLDLVQSRRGIAQAQREAALERLTQLAVKEQGAAGVRANELLLAHWGQRTSQRTLERLKAETAQAQLELTRQRQALVEAQTAVQHRLATADRTMMGDVVVYLGSLAGPPSDGDLAELGCSRGDLVPVPTQGEDEDETEETAGLGGE